MESENCIELIEDSLLNFLNSKILKVAVLKGAWGTGKTFFWRIFFNNNKKQLKNFRGYSYVSLFGISQFTDIKKQIFSNHEMLNLDEDTFTASLKKFSKPFVGVLESFDIPYFKSANSISSFIEDKTIENFLVCFDDLERKESKISVSSILGLISQLKEEKNCKVVLIYNDQELNERVQKDINEYRDKVVDLELHYNPPIKENLKIIWTDGYPSCVYETFKTLDLNNIRIMQRVKWVQDYFKDHLREQYDHLVPIFEYKSTVLTVLYYAYSKQFSIDEAISYFSYSVLLSKDDDKREKFKVLRALGYSPNNLDQIIVDFLKHGYLDFSKYQELLEARNTQSYLDDTYEKHMNIWSKYRSNFITTQKDFIQEHKNFLNQHWQTLPLGDVSKTVSTLNPNIS